MTVPGAPATVVLRGGLVLTPAGAVPGDVLLEDGRVAAVTPAAPRVPAPERSAPGHDVELEGRLVTPAFVDAHVHLAATGLAVLGADLSGARSAAEALERLAAQPPGEDELTVLLGHGWDETG